MSAMETAVRAIILVCRIKAGADRSDILFVDFDQLTLALLWLVSGHG